MSEVKVNKISPRTNCGTTQLGDAGDTITVTGDLKSNSLKSASGSTITLGQSGDTIQLGCGATQTGFGRTGTVDWDTTAKTASFTAVSGNGYFVNTASGAITVTMPASPSAGDIVALSDYAGTWGTNNVNLSSANYNGATGTPALDTPNQTVFLVYVDGTKGWITTNESTTRVSGFQGIVATGGTILTCGNYKTHVFTGPGTFCVSCAGPGTVEYLVVAGGGGGNSDWSGGSGAGGWRSYTSLPAAHPLNAPAALPVTATAYPITVGAGASGGTGPNGLAPANGSPSTFSTITSTGGGRAGQENAGTGGIPGGSGGGNYYASLTVGAGNTPPVSPPQGEPGGGDPRPPLSYGGGGGAAQAGQVGSIPQAAGAGGNGAYVPDAFFGPTAPSYGQSPAPLAPNGRYFAGGSSSMGACACGTQQCGGAGGGGKGGVGTNCGNATATAGAVNTGGGGGSGGGNEQPNPGKAGGSGIVAIRYRYQ
jgi:hypothetical protein